MNQSAFLFLFPLVLLPEVNAASITVPGTSPTGGVNTILRNAPRVYQEVIGASQLASLTQPVSITGIRFRLAAGENWRPAGYVGAAWPDAQVNFSDWTLQIGQASAAVVADGEIVASTTTFNANMGGSVIVARTGGLTIDTGSFSADGGTAAGAIHSFGPLISFTTPYTYTPGESLAWAVQHSGYGATGTPVQAFFDTAAFGNGIADAVSSTTPGATFASAPTGFTSPYIVEFEYTVIPEPGSAVVLLLTGSLFLRRRRC